VAWMFRRMVIAGVGLIGGSLGLAAREQGLVEEIIGLGRGAKNLRLAQRQGMIDRVIRAEDGIPQGTDLLIMATPVRSTTSLAVSLLPSLNSGCIVSDVGSVKAEIVREMDRLLPRDIPFVGAHPIAGSEQWGAGAARSDLFCEHRCILTPTRRTDSGALKKIASLWRAVGAKVEMMDPALHDGILGVVSHLPHVLVYALVNTLGRSKFNGVDVKSYCAGGFKDFTRIASSRPELWRDICLLNRQAIGKSLGDYIKNLEQLRSWIRQGRGAALERAFARASEVREQLG
jgi:prephenate dehydrogenase